MHTHESQRSAQEAKLLSNDYQVTRHGLNSDDVGDNRPRHYRLLFGVALVIIGLVWSILNGTAGTLPKGTATLTSVPRAVATDVKVVNGMRVRPILASDTQFRAEGTNIYLSFHNSAAEPRTISPHDLRLLIGGVSLSPNAIGAGALQRTTLTQGRYITGVLYFAHVLAPGATLVYTPTWAGSHALHWLLWR